MNPDQADILVVDDERDLAKLVAFNLQALRHTTRCAHTGEQALAMVAQRAPTLIVLDLMLPDISGKEVCRRLKADPATRDIPIIMLTAADSEVDRVVGFELGAADYVIKPFSTRELTLRVAAVLRRVQPRIPERVAMDRLMLQGREKRRRQRRHNDARGQRDPGHPCRPQRPNHATGQNKDQRGPFHRPGPPHARPQDTRDQSRS